MLSVLSVRFHDWHEAMPRFELCVAYLWWWLRHLGTLGRSSWWGRSRRLRHLSDVSCFLAFRLLAFGLIEV